MKKITFPPLVFLCFFFLAGVISSEAQSQRIVSLMPSQTEILFELGFGGQVVGVSDFCNFPSQTGSLTHVGGIDLNLEKIVSLKPTIIMDLDGMHRRYEFIFQQIGLKFRNYSIKKLSDIPIVAENMARDLGNPEAGAQFRKKWAEAFDSLPRFSRPGPKVYVEIWDAPLQGAGPESFIGEMVERAGGKNILNLTNSSFPVINSEEVVKANPEVILILYPLDSPEKIALRPGWSEITAVRKRNIRILENDVFVRPGPRCLEGIKKLIEIFQTSK